MVAFHEIRQRDDGLWQIGVDDSGPGPFESREFALRIANGHPPAPATTTKFRRFRVIREARDAPA